MTNKRQFKLVKDYPGNYLPIGTIVKQDDIGQYATLVGCSYFAIFSEDKIYNYPEFWKEAFEVADGYVTNNDTMFIVLPTINKIADYKVHNWIGSINVQNTFCNLSNAKARLKELQEVRDLTYYENILHDIIRNNNAFYDAPYYISSYLKDCEPKIYWLMVLQAIADDLNQGWVADWNNIFSNKYCIKRYKNHYTTELWSESHFGSVNFKSREDAAKAIKIMSDKLDYIFN